MAVGGEAVAREPSGRVVFVAGAAPDETVAVELVEERSSFARGRVVEVIAASPDRVDPPCPELVAGCGGCDWQHLSLDAQRRLRLQLVTEVLARAGSIADPVVEAGPDLAATRLRTSVRGTTDGEGRFAQVDPGGPAAFDPERFEVAVARPDGPGRLVVERVQPSALFSDAR